jgi:hypothetical protein
VQLVQLLVGDGRAHARAEYLRPAARHRVQPGLAQGDEDVAHRHLLDARDVRNLHRRQRLDVHVRVARLEGAEHLGVVLQPGLHVEPADDVELPRERRVRLIRLGQHLLQRVAVRTLLLGQARVRAEHAGLAQRADVGRVDVLVGGEGDAVAVHRAVAGVGQGAEAVQVRRPEQGDALVGRQALAALNLVGDGQEGRIGDPAPVHFRRSGHCGHSSQRRTASVTLWPPKPKLLLSAACIWRGTAVLGVMFSRISGSGSW